MVCFLILLLGIDCYGFKHLQFHMSWVLSTILCINLGNFFSNMYLIDIFVIKKYNFVIKKYYFGSKLLKSPIFFIYFP